MKTEGTATSYQRPLLRNNEADRYSSNNPVDTLPTPTGLPPGHQPAPPATKPASKIAMGKKELASVLFGFMLLILVVLAYYLFPKYLDQRSKHTPPPFYQSK